MKIRVVSKGERGNVKGHHEVAEIIGSKNILTFKYKDSYTEAFSIADIISPSNSKIQVKDGKWRSMTLEEFKELLA